VSDVGEAAVSAVLRRRTLRYAGYSELAPLPEEGCGQVHRRLCESPPPLGGPSAVM